MSWLISEKDKVLTYTKYFDELKLFVEIEQNYSQELSFFSSKATREVPGLPNLDIDAHGWTFYEALDNLLKKAYKSSSATV